MSYVSNLRDASARYPGIGIAYTKLTREECVALHRKLVREELEELERATRGSRINPAFYREFMKNYKAAKAKARIAHMFKEHDAQEATVIDAATDFDTRIKEITGVGHLFPARPVITFEELTYGKGARKCYVATISKVVTEGSHAIDLLNDIEFLIAGDFQAIPGVTYTVADYDTTTRKVTVTPLGE